MNNAGRLGLTARIEQIRRTLPSAATSRASAEPAQGPALVEALQARVADLENLVQGLQDSVYRDARRYDKRLDDLEARTDPAALAVALSKDARDRGL